MAETGSRRLVLIVEDDEILAFHDQLVADFAANNQQDNLLVAFLDIIQHAKAADT
jgi:hypothetical protein